MRKKTVLVVVAMVVAASHLLYGAGPAGQADCRSLTLSFQPDARDLSPKDAVYQNNVPLILDHFAMGSVGWCWSQSVVGSMGGVEISGTWVACGATNLAQFAPLFAGVAGRAIMGPDLYANPGIIRTKLGDIYTMSYSLSVYEGADDPWKAFGGVTWYGQGSGRFARTFGWSSDRSEQVPPTYWVESVGYLCFPARMPSPSPSGSGD